MEKASAINQAVFVSPRFRGVAVRTTRRSGRPYAPHLHDTLSLGVVFEGGTVMTTARERITLAAGEMVFIAPFETHGCNPVKGGMRSYHMFYLDREWAASVLGASPECGISVGQRVVRDRRLFAAVMATAAAFESGSVGDGDVGFLAELVAVHCTASPVGNVPVRKDVGREWHIRSFRRENGITPGSYGQCLRLARAMHMLERGGDIAGTAAACGFADQSHLHRMCVKYLSATPGQLKPERSLSYKK